MEERILGELKLDHEVPVETAVQLETEAPSRRSRVQTKLEAERRQKQEQERLEVERRQKTSPGEGSPGPRRWAPSPTPRYELRRWPIWLLVILVTCLITGSLFIFLQNRQAPERSTRPTPTLTVTPGLTPLATPLPSPIAAVTPAASPTPIAHAYAYPVVWLGLAGLAGLLMLIWFIVRMLRRPKDDSAKESLDSGKPGVRVSIGEPRCLREEAPAEGGLLIADDLKAYAHFNCAFYRLEFSLTMLPDSQRSLDRGEMSLRLLPDNRNAKLPFFVRLHPEQEVVVEKRTVKESSDGKAKFKIPTIGEAEAGGRMETGSDLDVEKVTVTSWGAGEQSGGWRFNATATRSIKTSIPGLTALVAIPSGQKAKGQFRAAAHVRSARARRLEPAPDDFVEYEFPPTLDVPPAVPAYI